jgi:hypothetical protein
VIRHAKAGSGFGVTYKLVESLGTPIRCRKAPHLMNACPMAASDPPEVCEEQSGRDQRVVSRPSARHQREADLLHDRKDFWQRKHSVVVCDEALQTKLVQGQDQAIVGQASGQPDVDLPYGAKVELRRVPPNDLQQDRFGRFSSSAKTGRSGRDWVERRTELLLEVVSVRPW